MSSASAPPQIVSCPSPDHAHLERVNYLFGYPINHSLSPLLHQTVYDSLGLRWAQLPLSSTDMSHFLELMKDPKFYGASVTMPHKVAIMEHLDEITIEGRVVGACNTIFVREQNGKRRFIGTNTDVIGVREAFYRNVPDPKSAFKGKPGMVIGGGGTTRSAVYSMKRWMGCDPIYLVNRDKREVDEVIADCTARGYGEGLIHVATVEQAEKLDAPGAIVGCVPNFTPVTQQERQARQVFTTMVTKNEKGAMLEMCYHPTPSTELSELARKAGWQIILGTEAMIWQGLEQDCYWTKNDVRNLPIERVKEAIAQALSKARL